MSSLPLSCSSDASVGSLQRAARCQGRLPPLLWAECPDQVRPGDVLSKGKGSILLAAGILRAQTANGGACLGSLSRLI